jgi:hypothetical protein
LVEAVKNVCVSSFSNLIFFFGFNLWYDLMCPIERRFWQILYLFVIDIFLFFEKGYWIVLDELNLAPSEVLEALNRLLDGRQSRIIHSLNTSNHKAASSFHAVCNSKSPWNLWCTIATFWIHHIIDTHLIFVDFFDIESVANDMKQIWNYYYYFLFLFF